MPKMKQLDKSLIEKLSIGMTINVQVAHEWKKDYGWSNYSTDGYEILEITKYQVRCRNSKYNCELLTISQKNIDEGFLKINIK